MGLHGLVRTGIALRNPAVKSKKALIVYFLKTRSNRDSHDGNCATIRGQDSDCITVLPPSYTVLRVLAGNLSRVVVTYINLSLKLIAWLVNIRSTYDSVKTRVLFMYF
jgi:hypothetical protein